MGHYYDTAMAPHLTLSIIKEILCLNTRKEDNYEQSWGEDKRS